MPDHVAALELLAEVLADERAAQERRGDALDSVAGLVLGFSGVLVALNADGKVPLSILSLIAAAVAAVLALVGFFPRPSSGLDVRGLRDRYLGADVPFLRLSVVDTRLEIDRTTRALLDRKARWVSAAVLALGAAVVLAAVAPIIELF